MGEINPPVLSKFGLENPINIMKVLVEIPDNEASFGMKVLQSLSFVKRAKPMSAAKVALWEDLKAAADEVRLHKQGKIKLKTAQELLDEL
ncbi:MAG: hypothetical protein V5804_08250 [Mucilaginibacter sp.]|uniref:hypothetical protein n=1 Tax=Mucilaginibacter sp. TaxID=1882438 RepID=UPI0034E44E82